MPEYEKYTLASVLDCLENERYEIVLDQDELAAAAKSLERMVKS
jgi:quinolinate synthase